MPSPIAAVIRSIAHACHERGATVLTTITMTTGTTTTTGGAGCGGETV
jgi:hypothetical protein